MFSIRVSDPSVFPTFQAHPATLTVLISTAPGLSIHLLNKVDQYTTAGLERLGFYGDIWAALRVGPRIALRVGPPDHWLVTGRAARAGSRCAPGRRQRYRVTAPLGLGANRRRTQIHTNGH